MPVRSDAAQKCKVIDRVASTLKATLSFAGPGTDVAFWESAKVRRTT
jgi:hypothetical protein